jgi:hypothetical protein
MNKLATGLMSVMLLGGAVSLASTAPASAGELCILGICVTLPGGPGGSDHPAPGPIAAAGAPILLLGYGAYWLIKRRRGGE